MAKGNDMENREKGKMDRVGGTMFTIYLACMALCAVFVLRILYIDLIFKPDPKLEKYLSTMSTKEILEPERGSILACDGRLLASTIPTYQLYMDCAVRKREFANMKNPAKGKEKEREWCEKARGLADSLAAFYGDMTGEQYYEKIISGRRHNVGYMKIGGIITHKEMRRIEKFPLFNEGKNFGGIIMEKYDTRKYPYESLARRAIGYVKDNRDTGKTRIGIEGKYNYILKGTPGIAWLKPTDGQKMIPDFDSTSFDAVNGADIRTTIDIDIQDIADRALRKNFEGKEHIEGGCVVVMDVKTGAIRAMVNLKKDGDRFGETTNYAIGRAADPGSVFKLTTLMTLLEDGKVTLDTKVPTFRGEWSWKGIKLPTDTYLRKRGDMITVADGLKISSNHVFRYLACTHYGNDLESQKRFVEKLYEYKMGETFDFDLEGLAPPDIPDPESNGWSATTLPSIAIGYSVLVTPLHILSFYNAIANGGKMVRPYIAEDSEYEGRTEHEFGGGLLSGAICSEATADTLVRALRLVVTEGTGSKLKNAKCPVAGKTGTAQMLFTDKETGKSVYKNGKGFRKHQGSFAGFFPADDPQYSAIVVVYSQPSGTDFYGGGIPAATFLEIVNGICALSPDKGNEIVSTGSVPVMRNSGVTSGADNIEEVPDVRGLGLADALWSVENCGYECVYEGTGHVVSQSPAAGAKKKKGETVRLTLR